MRGLSWENRLKAISRLIPAKEYKFEALSVRELSRCLFMFTMIKQQAWILFRKYIFHNCRWSEGGLAERSWWLELSSVGLRCCLSSRTNISSSSNSIYCFTSTFHRWLSWAPKYEYFRSVFRAESERLQYCFFLYPFFVFPSKFPITSTISLTSVLGFFLTIIFINSLCFSTTITSSFTTYPYSEDSVSSAFVSTKSTTKNHSEWARSWFDWYHRKAAWWRREFLPAYFFRILNEFFESGKDLSYFFWNCDLSKTDSKKVTVLNFRTSELPKS